MDREPRFEIVTTDAGYHARFVAGNGETVWTTEVYERYATAVQAIVLVRGADEADVRDVDERTDAHD